MNTLHFQKMSGAYTPLAGPVLRITPALAQSSQIQIAPDKSYLLGAKVLLSQKYNKEYFILFLVQTNGANEKQMALMKNKRKK